MKDINVHITPISSNSKTGAIPVTVTGSESCSDNCPLKAGGCYAKNSFLGMHWRKVTAGERGKGFNDMIRHIKSLDKGTIWRHNAAGDLHGHNDTIDTEKLDILVKANKGKRGFTYTHKPLTSSNLQAIMRATVKGFTINLSSNNLAHADKLYNKTRGMLPLVTLLPEQTGKVNYTPDGHKVVTCPATHNDNMDCKKCKLCAIPDRNYIIGFPVHGSSKKSATINCQIS